MMYTPANDPEDSIYDFMDPYLSIPSPLNIFEFDGAILQYHDPRSAENNMPQTPAAAGAGNEPISTSTKIVEQGNGRSSHGPSKKVARRRSPKGDRHSKIPTAHGLRDRRMRLSLDVARQFFKLQDMLSLDKPSKTVKWLLMQAKSAIEELKKATGSSNITDVAKSASPTSEGEVVEGAIIDEEIVTNGPSKEATSTKDKSKKARKSNTLSPASKEARKKAREEARERARERTQKKSQSRLLNDPGDDEPSLDVLFEYEQQVDQDERTPLGSTEGFTTNWSMMSLNYLQEDDTFQANPIQEFQFHGASREPYGNPNLGQYWYQ